MPIKPYIVQRRMMELGRVRLGEKGSRGEPKKLTTLRFTSASRALLDAIAATHGGTVKEWKDAPDEGYFEVTTEATQIDIVLPPVFSDQDGAPTAPYSQFFEMWSAGGCARRCDGETELLTNKPCLCAAKVAAKGEDARDCKVTTRVSFMIPDVPGLGVWRLESHGYNAAVELPGTLEVLLLAAAEHKFIPAVLRVEQRTKKVPGEGTRRFVVPVIELPNVTVKQLAAGEVPLILNAPAGRAPRPELPAVAVPDDGGELGDGSRAAFGAPPALPGGTVTEPETGREPLRGGAAPVRETKPPSGSATVPHKEPPVTQPAGPPDAVTGDAATSGGSPSPGGTSQQAEGGVPPGTTAPPPAAGIASLLPLDVQAQLAGDHVIPSGKYKGKKISEVDDARWFASMLAAKPSPTKTAVETYANAHPELVSA